MGCCASFAAMGLDIPPGVKQSSCLGRPSAPHLRDAVDGASPLTVRVERIAEPEASGSEVEARFLQLRERAMETLRLIEQAPAELAAAVRSRCNRRRGELGGLGWRAQSTERGGGCPEFVQSRQGVVREVVLGLPVAL